MTAIELVSDREKKTPLDKKMSGLIQDAVYANGVMVRISGPNMILSPPLIIDEHDTQHILTAIEAALASVGS